MEIDDELALTGGIDNFTGYWTNNGNPPATGSDNIRDALFHTGKSFYLVWTDSGPAVASGGRAVFGDAHPNNDSYPILAFVPKIPPSGLGDPSFLKTHKASYPLMAGSMAHGISSAEMIEALVKEGFPAFLGTAGMGVSAVENLIGRLRESIKDGPWGVNLIHTPSEPTLEEKLVDIYLSNNVSLIEASAYMGLTPALVRFRLKGIKNNPDGSIHTPNRIIAKVSRSEVAARFMDPAPMDIVKILLENGLITEEEAELSAFIPMASDITVEADSGGHTDNRPAIALFPGIAAQRDGYMRKNRYNHPVRLGLGGGISTPSAAAAAFSMGAAYVVTGSVNQACVESGTSKAVKEILSKTEQADVIMAPAADMFEMGVKVQVLKRGTMFAMRANRLYDIYSRYGSFEEIPLTDRSSLEKGFFRASFEEVWQKTVQYFQMRDPSQISRGEKDPKHRMALVFRWYLSQSSHWAIEGEESRRMDYQIWCGPSMGAFNQWVRGTFLENPENRHVVNVSKNIIFGAAVIERLNILRRQTELPQGGYIPVPLEDKELINYMS